MNEEQMKHIANLISQDIEKDKEIERLNNIIDELERTIYYRARYFRDVNEKSKVEICMDILDKLKELKEGKNEAR